MNDRIRQAFDTVQADEALLQSTMDRVHGVAQGRRHSSAKKQPVLAAAAAVLLVALSTLAYNLLLTADAYVSIDVNPSVELTVNRMGRVIGTHAFNPEGEALLSETKPEGKRIEDAAQALVTAMSPAGYLDESALIAVSVQAGERKSAGLCDLLMSVIDSALGEKRARADVEVFPVSREIRGQAQGCHMSPAKYLAVLELMEVDQDATPEAYGHHSIQQIRDRTAQCRGGGGMGHGGHGHADR